MEFELNRLGWREFQDLCALILQHVLGATFHTFADSNDAGRDGAFHGRSRLAGTDRVTDTVVQCKFSAREQKTLTPGMLRDELRKAADLRSRGLCDSYIVMTNMRVSGRTEAWLRKELSASGIEHSEILDGAWIGQQIQLHASLRRLVPRLYGLGDLSEILDERAVRQADMLLGGIRDSLTTFVPTAAYTRAISTLESHRFVLLLGEPGAGKSTIASVLALLALDSGARQIVRANTPDEIVAHLNPDEPKQLFWVDDAFGSVRHDPQLSQQWRRQFPMIRAGIENGAQIIVTSRSQIFHEARPDRDDGMEAWLSRHHITIELTELSVEEKTAMLYNHLRQGDQPPSTLARWKPYLSDVAKVSMFRPEIARRLGSTSFVEPSALTSMRELIAFFEHPRDYLVGVLRQLDRAKLAALACVFLEQGTLHSPVKLEGRLLDCVTRLGADPASTMNAFHALRGSFLTHYTDDAGEPVWAFHHPTIREAFTLLLGDDPNALEIIVEGLTEREIADELYCAGPLRRANTLQVPPSWYARLATRVALEAYESSGWSGGYITPGYDFLIDSCSDEFLRVWAEKHPDLVRRLADYFEPSPWANHTISAADEPINLLVRLTRADAVDIDTRRRVASGIQEELVRHLDSGWLDEQYSPLLPPGARSSAIDEFIRYSVPRLRELAIEAIDWDPYDTPREQIGPMLWALKRFESEVRGQAPHAAAQIGAVLIGLELEMKQRQVAEDQRLAEWMKKFPPPTPRPERLRPTDPPRERFDDLI